MNQRTSLKPLSNIVVLDLTRFFSGPHATLMLAGLGAEVIKIDDPKTGDPAAMSPPFAGPNGVSFQRQTEQDMGIPYLKRARGKKSVHLDLKSPDGLGVFLKMVKNADVVIDNFSVGVTRRLGISHEQLCAVNPKIITCSLTGYGASGSDQGLKAYDLMIQAATGLMSITGDRDGPPMKTGSSISDAVAGVHAAMGVVSALLHRERTGEGQAIDVSMTDCLFSLLFDEPFDCYDELGLSQRQGNRIMRFSPFNMYDTRDGRVVLGAATAADWRRLLEVIEREDLLASPDMMNAGWRIEHNAEIDSIVSSWTTQHTTQAVIDALNAREIPCSPVRTIEQALEWPQLRQRNMISHLWNPLSQSFVRPRAPGFPIKFSEIDEGYAAGAPVPGEHTKEVLARLAGLDENEITALLEAGIVKTSAI